MTEKHNQETTNLFILFLLFPLFRIFGIILWVHHKNKGAAVMACLVSGGGQSKLITTNLGPLEIPF